MKTSQLNPTPSGVLGTVAKLIRLTEKEDVEWSHWQHPTNNVTARRNLAKYLKMGCPEVSGDGEVVTPQLPDGEELCRLILGNDFLSSEDVAKVYGFSYTDEQTANFAETLPDFKTLIWLRTNSYMLVATTPSDLNILQVRYLDNKLFCSKTEGWYAENKEKFAQTDVVKAGEWLAIRKDEVPNSFSKTWKEQQDLITEVEHVPNAPEVSYAITAYFKVRGVYLLRSEYVKTSSVDADGHHVVVGEFDEDGLGVSNHWDDTRCCSIGVLSARKGTLNT